MSRGFTTRQAWAITGSYWAVMTLITHLPPIFPGTGEPSPALGIDKLGHLTGFMILAFLLRALVGWRVWLIVVVTGGYGVVDELTQPWVGRTADVLDWVADMLGVGLGLAAAILWTRVRRPQRPADAAGEPAGPVADAVHPEP